MIRWLRRSKIYGASQSEIRVCRNQFGRSFSKSDALRAIQLLFQKIWQVNFASDFG